MNILEKLRDLHKQATTERSHFYVASCCKEAIEAIEDMRDAAMGVLLSTEPAKFDNHSMVPNRRIKRLADAIRPACSNQQPFKQGE